MRRAPIVLVSILAVGGIAGSWWAQQQDSPPSVKELAGPKPGPREANDFFPLSFESLSSFPYRVYEVVSETGGRPKLKSDDVIPAHVKAFDGRRVAIRGYVLPLRLKKGKVTELLLLRDQGTCCFGEAAQINHFIRVSLPKNDGLDPTIKTLKVFGQLQVGETYVEGYLTGIYALTAEKATEDKSF